MTANSIKSPDPISVHDLRAGLERCMLEHQFRLQRSLQDAIRSGAPLDKLADRIEKSRQLADWRRANLPVVDFPEQLPISEHAERLGEMIRKNPVLVICGETGSGKSTQIPKICLAAGYGVQGMICQTQPRRIAARSVAARVAEEMGSELGEQVGFRVRFSEQVSERNYIRVLTDGMLLAEFERDRFLERYEVVIIDEAHERSLNIDFLLGLAQRIINKRPNFRLIITSATLDSEKFSKHFNDAPQVQVSGRTYPVECRYRPLALSDDGTESLPQAIHQAVEELHAEQPGDVLVFLPGEREIREAAEWLGKRIKPGIDILPLYARLTPAEQQRIFHPGQRSRIILATNVAETSLTVPGIRTVIDSGLARVSRYSPSRKLQRLPLEKISQAAANQRAGRCGRVASGICIRLYGEDDYDNRSLYTDPEILRTSLADVILRMKTLGIGEIDTFPFVDLPGRRQINDGLQQLVERGAIARDYRITDIGRQMARIPVDPRVARMLLAASHLNCLEEVVVIAAALSLPDPRQSPADKLQHSRQVHREISKEGSDFLVLLDIWQQFRRIQKTESKRQAFRWCEDHFLSKFRMREWAALQANIKQILKQLKFKFSHQQADADTIHRALLSGLLSNIGQLAAPAAKASQPKTPNQKGTRKSKAVEYSGTFGKTLQIFPASTLYGKTPKWIMCAELVETAQVFARTNAILDPKWLEATAEHLLQFHYSNPRWDPRQERVVAMRRATLYGLTIYTGRKCDYSRINPEDCRMIFIRSALVDGELDSHLPFYQHNRDLVAEIESLEHRTRRRDILVDDMEIFQFYDEVIPASVNSASGLRKWHRRLDKAGKAALEVPRERLMLGDPRTAILHFPDSIDNNGITLPLDYLFDPTSDRDGVTARIKLPLLNQMNAAVFERLVPGLMTEKLIALVRSLPKATRRNYVPIPDTIGRVLRQVVEDPRPLRVALADALNGVANCNLHPADFDLSVLPDYLRIGLELIDESDRSIGFSKDFDELQSRYGQRAHVSFVDSGDADIERSGITSWDFDSLPTTIQVQVGDYQTLAWPALVDCEDSVAIEVFDHPDVAADAHREGVRRLLWLGLPAHRKLVKKPLPEWQRISLMYAAIGPLDHLQLAMFHKAQDLVFFDNQEPVRSRQQFNQMLTDQAPGLPQVLVKIAGWVAETLSIYREVIATLNQRDTELAASTGDDIQEQIEWLVYDGFVDNTPVHWLEHLPRYLQGINLRLGQARLDSATDQLRQARIKPWRDRYMNCDFEYSEVLDQFRWLLEEYRISVFAQGLGTSVRVSDKRMLDAWKQVEFWEREKNYASPDKKQR